jgi:hypothetical protein
MEQPVLADGLAAGRNRKSPDLEIAAGAFIL